MSLQRLLSVLVLSSLAPAAVAQVEHGGEPPSGRLALRKPVPTERMRPVDAERLLAEDAAGPRTGPLRFGEPLAVEIDLARDGAWETLAGGDRVWRVRIESPGAKSLALVFARFQLPPGGELYVYDDARATVRGAYTSLEHLPDGTFAVRPLRGDALTLEYFEPAARAGEGELVVATVTHDYRDVVALVEDRSGGGGAAGACQLDLACPIGAGWEDQRDATVHVTGITAGTLCSGTLVNNTAQDGAVLVLTAAHCGGLTNAIYTFNFERPGCRDGVAPCDNQLTSATLLAKDLELDVQLLRLNVPVGPLPFPAHLAGWDRSDVVPSQVTVLHHPSGREKKISQDFDPPRQFEGTWRIRDWDRGTTEHGSSGGGTYDTAGRLIGVLDRGASSCEFPDEDDFATRLSTGWPLLEPYLDPLGTGQLALDGLALDQVAPQPFAVAGVVPDEVEALEPSVLRPLRIVGSGFDDTAELRIDGVVLAPLHYRRGGHAFFNIDLPPTTVGTHVATVIQNGRSGSATFDVVACTEPRLQTQNGYFQERVFSAFGVDTYHADVPGHVHYCIWSLSDVPSVHPRLSLSLGNAFTDIRSCRVNPIPASGMLRVHHTMAPGKLPIGTLVYNQSVCVNHGVPLRTSGMQTTVFMY